MKKLTFYIASVVSCVIFLASCASTSYIEKNYSLNTELLKSCAPYATGSCQLEKTYLVDEERALQIREYFKANAGLDLEELAASGKSTWEKAVELAVFVIRQTGYKVISNSNAE